MSDFSQVTDHPDFQEIVSKIVTGTHPKDISNWLKVKYPDKDQKHLVLSESLIENYTDKHANMTEQFKQDVLLVKSGKASVYKMSPALMNNKTYQERLLAFVDEKIDTKKEMNGLIMAAKARLEQVFDAIQENPTSTKADYVLLKWFETLVNAVEKMDRMVNHTPDQIIQHNYQIQIQEQHVNVFQEAIRETLAAMDTEAALLFMEIFPKKLSALKSIQEPYVNEAKVIKESLAPILEEANFKEEDK